MSTTAQLTLDIKSYWHTGNGQGDGYHLDALCERDQDKLPMIPGRQIKGLLRHCVRRAEAWGWLANFTLPEGYFNSHEELLFGTKSQEVERYETQPGVLIVENAHLPDAERQWLALEEAAEMRAELFTELYSTAIDANTGSARQYSLRGMEACIPLQLLASIDLMETALEPSLRAQQQVYLQSGSAWKVLAASLPLLDSIGANRSRGFGEVIASLDQGASVQKIQVKASQEHSGKSQKNPQQAKKHQKYKRKGR
jgi:CRISPR/Cas system CSM-associated protein Csm3 (group 7 of RAMP superfamily)